MPFYRGLSELVLFGMRLTRRARWQAITAAGSGCTAALAAERYLAANGLLTEVHQEKQKSRSKPAKEPEKEVRTTTGTWRNRHGC